MNKQVVPTSKTSESKVGDNVVRQQYDPSVERHVSTPADQILSLQRTAGNQAVESLFRSGGIQAKLEVGRPDDICEQEADRVAEQVMRMPDPQVRQSPLRGTPLVQREVDEGEEDAIQAKSACGEVPQVTPDMESSIQSLKDRGGAPLDPGSRAFFEFRFQRDFSGVRIHSDANAMHATRLIKAKAFTFGNDIVFNPKHYAPSTEQGKNLLAHELAHVLQQTRSQFQTGTMPVPAPANSAMGGGVLQRTEDTFDRLLSKGPEYSRPESSRLKIAENAIKSGKAVPADLEVLLEMAIADFRSSLLTETSDVLGSRELTGMCGFGRDYSIISLGTMLQNSPQPVKIYRFQARKVFGIKGGHGFGVAVFPDKTAYLIDPTYSQFFTAPGQITVNYKTAGILRDGGVGERMAYELIKKGFIRLTEENAAQYAKGLGVPERNLINIADRLIAGQNADLTDIVGEGRGTALKVNSNIDALFGDEVISSLKKRIDSTKQIGDPGGFVPELEKFLDRLQKQKAFEKSRQLLEKGKNLMNRAGALALEWGPKAMKTAGFIATVYGTHNMAAKASAELGNNPMAYGDAMILGTLAGFLDDALMAADVAATGGGSYVPHAMETWDTSGASPAQVAVIEAYIEFFRSLNRK